MILKRNYKNKKKHVAYSLAIGNFDGLHLGHRFILKELKKLKNTNEDKLAVLTFYPHPMKVLNPSGWKKNLIRFKTKYRLLSKIGIDVLFQIPFNFSFSNLSANFFVENILIKNLNTKNVIVGEDFRFGKNREGDVRLLKKYSGSGTFNFKCFKKKSNEENVYSSSIIRNLIKSGDIKKANSSLGYNWEVEGKVVKGRAKGRELGFPTANINYSYQISPDNGIYAGWVKIEGEKEWRQAAISTGFRPHYDGETKILEVHILFFSANLYQKSIRVAFVKKIRDERKFDNEEKLILQMNQDCKTIQNILNKNYIINDNEGTYE